MGNKLEGKTALVTGAGRGIARGIAVLMAREGAKVVVNDLGGSIEGEGSSQALASQVAEEINADGGEAVPHFGDVSNWDDAEDMVRTAIDRWDKLDILVNVAGIVRERMVFNMTEEEWDDVIRVHLKGTFCTTHFASIHWRQRREYGRLINFTSGDGIEGAPGQANYAAAKAGIIGFTSSCANALVRYNVTANCIAPGAATRMTDRGLNVGRPPGSSRRPNRPWEASGTPQTSLPPSSTWPARRPATSPAGSSCRRAIMWASTPSRSR